MTRPADLEQRDSAMNRAGNALAIAVALSAGVVADAAAASFECLIEPNQVVEIRSPVEGLIDKVHVQRGDNVKKGQVLVELESNAERSAAESARYRATMEGRIVAAQNRVEYATKKLQRADELHLEAYIPAQQRDDAETERKLAEAELKDAVENRELAKLERRHAEDLLNLRTLRSPFDGLVVDRLLNPGDLAEAGTGRKPILKLAQIHPLRVEAIVPQAHSGRLKVGMTGSVTPEHGSGAHTATIKVVDRVMDAASGTFGVRLELPNPSGSIAAGVKCQVEFAQITAAEEKARVRK